MDLRHRCHAIFECLNDVDISVLELFLFCWHVLSVKFMSCETLLSNMVLHVVNEKYFIAIVPIVLVEMTIQMPLWTWRLVLIIGCMFKGTESHSRAVQWDSEGSKQYVSRLSLLEPEIFRYTVVASSSFWLLVHFLCCSKEYFSDLCLHDLNACVAS
jgi:hypothetical protein